jgi:hypothetical protein
MPRRILTFAALVALALVAPGTASALRLDGHARPSTLDAHNVIHQVFDQMAGSLDDHGRVVIGRCSYRGMWRVCPATVVAGKTRLRFITRMTRTLAGDSEDDSFVFASRLIRRSD